MTKETIDSLLERLDRLGLGTDNGDGVYTQSDGLLVSVTLAPPYFRPPLNSL